MRSLVFLFGSVIVGAHKQMKFHFLSQSTVDVASPSSPRTDVQTKIDRTPQHSLNGTENDTVVAVPPSPGTNFHTLTEHAQANSLDLKVCMGPREIQLYDQMLSKGSVYFEFGLGGSTLFASKHSNLNHITAVDSSRAWIIKVQSEGPIAAGIQDGRIQIKYADIGPVGGWGYPITRNAVKERAYSKTIIGASPVPDVVLVDGRYRVACALRTVLEAVDNGWPNLILMIHDYERHEYSTNINPLLGMPNRIQGSNGRLLAAWELTGATLGSMRGDGQLLGKMRWQLQQSELTPILVIEDDGIQRNASRL